MVNQPPKCTVFTEHLFSTVVDTKTRILLQKVESIREDQMNVK